MSRKKREVRKYFEKDIGSLVIVSTPLFPFPGPARLDQIADDSVYLTSLNGSPYRVSYDEIRRFHRCSSPKREKPCFALVRYVPQAMQLYRGNDDMYKAA